MSAPEPVSIIIPAFNQVDYCRACIESINAHTTWPYRLILVDNGSTDGVSEYFDTLADQATIIHTGANIGFSGGVNRGMEVATGHVLLLNSDTVVTPGWLSRLVQVLEEPGMGLVGPVSNSVAGPQQIDGLEALTDSEAVAYAVARTLSHAGQYREVSRLIGFCLLIHNKVVADIGVFDERYETGNFEDDDYCTRVRQAGFSLAIVDDSFVYHHGGRTMAAMGLHGTAYNDLMERNRQRYEEKWGVTLSREKHGRIERERLQVVAQDALTQGDVQGALAALQAAIVAEPEAATPYRDLGKVLLDAGKAQLALQCFQQAQERDPALDGLATLLAQAKAQL